MCIDPCPFVKKKRSLVLFHDISLTSNPYCSSDFILCVLASMKVTKSSLFPTAIVSPFGAQVMFMFSPLVLMVATHLATLVSHILTDLSPLAVLRRSGWDWCQHSWSTDPPCPLNVTSLFWKAEEMNIKYENTFSCQQVPACPYLRCIYRQFCRRNRMRASFHRNSILQSELSRSGRDILYTCCGF